MAPYVSITITAVYLLGIFLCLVGIYFVARGKSSTAFEFKFGNFTIKTRQVGLAILAIGALMILVAMTYSGNMVPLYKTF